MKLGIILLFAALLVLLAFYYEIQFSTYPYILTTSTRRLINNQTLLPTKVIFIVIDALRYDYYQRLPVLSKITANYPQNSFVSKTKVGSPTMTTQRIQSLMTGSEIFSSSNILKTFLASKTDLDNIITQLTIHNKTSMVFGDDTWVKLFDFTHSKICSQTFNVHDYDTCDKLIYRFLSQKIYGKDYDDSYNFLVAHFLALDHIGHATSSLTDKIMDVKMKEISTFLEQITDKMENGTMVLVTGDHGMRNDGNHGGSSVDQTETFLFGYLKGIELYNQQKRNVVSQGDITATLSVLLNIPIPSNTVGYPILQALPRETVDNKNIWNSINQQIYQHFSTILKFYSVSINLEQKVNIKALFTGENPQKLQNMFQNVTSQLKFLNYSSPNPYKAILTLVFLSIVTFSIITYSFFRQLKYILTSNIFHIGMILPIFTLFCVNFSWFLIQQLSNVLSLVFIGIIFISIFKANNTLDKYSVKIISFISTLTCYCFLAQIQPKKVNDYATGFLRNTIINQICNDKIVIAVISSLSILIYFRGIVRKIRKNRLTTKEQPSQWHEYLKLLILLLSYINYISTYYSNQSFYLLRICLCFIIIGWALFSKTNTHSIFLIFNFLLFFLGQAGPIILLTCYYIELNCYSLKIYPLIMSILAESIWWWMGNRYEYSGIDVMKSYVFCPNYVSLLNAICLLIYILSPYLLVFFMINYRMHFESIQTISAPAEKIENSQNQLEQHQSLRSTLPKQNSNNSKQQTRQQQNNKIQTVNLQFISLFLLGLLSCAWNVHYNNEKILFTIVYVPMLLFCTIKSVGLMTITILTICNIRRISLKTRK